MKTIFKKYINLYHTIVKRICIIIREAMEGTFSCFYNVNACFVVQLSLFIVFVFLAEQQQSILTTYEQTTRQLRFI